MEDSTKTGAKYNVTINLNYSGKRDSDAGYDLASLFGDNFGQTRTASEGYDLPSYEKDKARGNGRGLPGYKSDFEKYLKKNAEHRCPFCRQHVKEETGAKYAGVKYDR
jgi:hypothetical protein